MSLGTGWEQGEQDTENMSSLAMPLLILWDKGLCMIIAHRTGRDKAMNNYNATWEML